MFDVESALLKCVLDSPDDDGPRLVLCDWWEENGQPERAEFCRVQVDLAKSGCGSLACENSICGPLRERERKLIMWMGKEVVPKIRHNGVWGYDANKREWSMGGTISGILRRGFIESVTLSWPDCRDYLDAIRAAQPVTQVRLTTWPEERPYEINNDGQWRLVGRSGWYNRKHPEENVLTFEKCLAREWPGIAFELPPWRINDPFPPGSLEYVGSEQAGPAEITHRFRAR